MKTLTIFTPTYNRAYSLHLVYEALLRQTSNDFEWLIIDDGSTDDTKQLVQGWIDENKIKIRYIYQQNQGMHGGHNTAYDNITTEYNTCIDSDDYMPDNAVAEILKNVQGLDASFAGIVGLDIDKTGHVTGTSFPEGLHKTTLRDIYGIHSVTGDKKLVLKTDIIRKYPKYPLFPGEKFVPLGHLYSLIDNDYFLKPVNIPFVVVEYLPDGSSLNMLKQYRKNPRGFAFTRVHKIKNSNSASERFKNAVHLVSSAMFTKDISLLKQSKSPFLILAASPFGLALNFYIRLKT